VQPLDDIAALPERPQALFHIISQNPARGAGWFSDPQPLERPHPADPDIPQRIASGVSSRPNIHYSIGSSRFPGQHPIEPGPAFGTNFSLKSASHLKLRSRAEFSGNKISRSRPQPCRNVIAADDEVDTVIGAAAHEDVDMGMLGIPVVDGDPVKPRAEITRGLIHELAGKAPQALKFTGIIRRDDEPEMMPVGFAAFRECAAVGIIAGSIEEFTRRSIAGNAVPPEIADMGAQCPGRPHPAHHPRLDHSAAGAVVEKPCCGKARRTAAPEGSTPLGSAASKTACLLRGSKGLRQKRFCLGRARRTDATWADAKIVVAVHFSRHRVSKAEEEQRAIKNDKLRLMFAMFRACLNSLAFPRQPTDRTLRLLSCHPRSALPCDVPVTLKHAIIFANLRRSAIAVIVVAPGLNSARTSPSREAQVQAHWLWADLSTPPLTAQRMSNCRQSMCRRSAQQILPIAATGRRV
jgi:hypothetical protein